jgi:hypothetical protein
MRSSSQPRTHDFCRQLTANNTHTHIFYRTHFPKPSRSLLQKLHVSWRALQKKKKVLQFTVSLYILGSHKPLARLVETPPVSHRNNKEKKKKRRKSKIPHPPPSFSHPLPGNSTELRYYFDVLYRVYPAAVSRIGVLCYRKKKRKKETPSQSNMKRLSLLHSTHRAYGTTVYR